MKAPWEVIGKQFKPPEGVFAFDPTEDREIDKFLPASNTPNERVGYMEVNGGWIVRCRFSGKYGTGYFYSAGATKDEALVNLKARAKELFANPPI